MDDMGAKPIQLTAVEAGRYVSVNEAAKRQRCTTQHIRNRLYIGSLTRYKFHGKTLIALAELEGRHDTD